MLHAKLALEASNNLVGGRWVVVLTRDIEAERHLEAGDLLHPASERFEESLAVVDRIAHKEDLPRGRRDHRMHHGRGIGSRHARQIGTGKHEVEEACRLRRPIECRRDARHNSSKVMSRKPAGCQFAKQADNSASVGAGGLLHATLRDLLGEQSVGERCRQRLEDRNRESEEWFEPGGRDRISHQVTPGKNSMPMPSTVGTTSARSR